MKLVEIKELSLDDLKDQVKKSSLELVDLRMKFAVRQLTDPSQLSKKRKEIARLLTIQTQKLNEEGSKTAKPETVKKPVKKVKKDSEVLTVKKKTERLTKEGSKKK